MSRESSILTDKVVCCPDLTQHPLIRQLLGVLIAEGLQMSPSPRIALGQRKPLALYHARHLRGRLQPMSDAVI